MFAGKGEYGEDISKVANINNVGFKSGEDLDILIREARFSVCPSECYENCPFTVIESQCLGTPVIGSDLGGIPELIDIGKTGDVFEAGNVEAITNLIKKLWHDDLRITEYSEKCKQIRYDD